MNDLEIWKPIPNFDGYEVSNLGNVRSYRRHGGGKFQEVPHQINSSVSGNTLYQSVGIIGNDGKPHPFKVGALVLTAFHGDRPAGFFMCHKDDNPKNDRLENLYWGSPKDNGRDNHLNHLMKGQRNKCFKLNINRKQRFLLRAHIAKRIIELYHSKENKKYSDRYYSLERLSKMTGKTYSAVSRMVNVNRSARILRAVYGTQPVAAA